MLYHTFPVLERIYTGKSDVQELNMRATYDYGLGVMTSSTDFNGFVSTYAYDPFAACRQSPNLRIRSIR